MDEVIKDERGSVGIYILAGILIITIMFSTAYFVLAEEMMHTRQVGLDCMEHAGIGVLYQSIEYDLNANQYVITWSTAQLEKVFNQEMAQQGFTKYTITKFEVIKKGDKDIMGHPFAQPGLYIQLNLPLDGHNVPIGQDFVVPPFDNATGVYPK